MVLFTVSHFVNSSQFLDRTSSNRSGVDMINKQGFQTEDDQIGCVFTRNPQETIQMQILKASFENIVVQ